MRSLPALRRFWFTSARLPSWWSLRFCSRGSETPKDGVFSHTWLLGLAIAAAVFAVLGWAVMQSARVLAA